MWWHTRRNQISSFARKGRVPLNRRGRQFSRLLAAEVCASAVVMLDTPCVKNTGYPLHSPVSPSLPLPCVTVCHHISTGLFFYQVCVARYDSKNGLILANRYNRKYGPLTKAEGENRRARRETCPTTTLFTRNSLMINLFHSLSYERSIAPYEASSLDSAI
jgi:hypothetical protein